MQKYMGHSKLTKGCQWKFFNFFEIFTICYYQWDKYFLKISVSYLLLINFCGNLKFLTFS